MTKNTPESHSEDDDGDESDREQKATVKAYALLVYAYLRGGLRRVLDELSKAADEIAPQLTGALSGVSVPARAWKPLGLAAVLLIAAVAIPAAPIGDDPSASVETQEPVEGETFETETEPDTDSETSTEPERSTLNGVTLNELPSSFLDGSPDAPAPPEQVRSSAGSQTMNVETAVVDGEPAIVLEDDRTHDGRDDERRDRGRRRRAGDRPRRRPDARRPLGVDRNVVVRTAARRDPERGVRHPRGRLAVRGGAERSRRLGRVLRARILDEHGDVRWRSVALGREGRRRYRVPVRPQRDGCRRTVDQSDGRRDHEQPNRLSDDDRHDRPRYRWNCCSAGNDAYC
ncbi:hypothetical protein DJ79_05065 [Halorubrum ezzemoulense]|uniref:Uncharacterized protein n=1 Tax=Halorubrum ezzemoulense TaxID=337243 RepID=A0A256JJ11_HALEZ|nr:hypothetical protein DJ79_05065 [Halorubrum ezzemoulense]